MASSRLSANPQVHGDDPARRREHSHLAVAHPQHYLRRFFVVGLSLAAIALFAISLTKPWWQFKLYAPQYPHGLSLVISLRGLSGDVREISMLNHYIGMAPLETAAMFERQYATQAVAVVCLLVLGATLLLGRRLGRLIVLIGALFPLGFIADSFYWLHRFGHGLDPHAPLHIPTFTPQLFGNGTIGQFMTFAVPALGFWLAVGGVVVLAGVVFARGRVCKTCKYAGTCGAVCKMGFVFPARDVKSAH
jgi:copper chaperone NosL